MAANDEITKTLERMLFAEDLVSYIMSLHTDVDKQYCVGESYRDSVYNGFNDVMRRAVDFLDSARTPMDVKYEFPADSSGNMLFLSKIDEAERSHFPNGFNVNNFLPYCVHAAHLAANFYRKEVHKTPSIAIMSIVTTFADYDMATGGWDTLNGIAAGYLPED